MFDSLISQTPVPKSANIPNNNEQFMICFVLSYLVRLPTCFKTKILIFFRNFDI